MAQIHHDISSNPLLSILISVFGMAITAITSYTSLVPQNLQEFAYVIAIASGIFSIANIVVGWMRKKK